MKKLLSIFAVAAMMLTACSQKEAANEAAEEANVNPLAGTWIINYIQLDDSTYMAPATIDSIGEQYVNFADDSTYGITTNCNTFSGVYILKGDSIEFANQAATTMACDNQQLETLLSAVLADLATYQTTDTTAVLHTTNPAAYIELLKVVEPADTVVAEVAETPAN